MDLTNSVWRPRAKIVAYVDLVLSAVMLFALIALVILATAAASVGIGWLWVGVVFVAVITGVNIWAALKLLSAAEVGRGLQEALDKARIWRNVKIIFFVLEFLMGIFSSWIFLVVTIAWHVGVLFIVCNFIKEMESVIVSQFTAGFPMSILSRK